MCGHLQQVKLVKEEEEEQDLNISLHPAFNPQVKPQSTQCWVWVSKTSKQTALCEFRGWKANGTVRTPNSASQVTQGSHS